MGPHNITLPNGLSEDQIAARQDFFEQSMRAASALSAQLRLAQEQQRAAELEAQIVADTGLSLPQLIAIERFLASRK